MPNNLIFNNVADQLLTQIYGTDGIQPRAVKTDSSGRLEVVGTFTAVTTPTIASYMTELTGATGTGAVMTIDTSAYSMYSFYIKNLGSASFTARLEISPNTLSTYFADDKSGDFILGTGSSSIAVLVPKHYLNYTRVYYEAPVDGITAQVWFNGKS